MSRFIAGLLLTFLMFLPLAVAVFAPAGWSMCVSIVLMLLMQIAAMVCFYTQPTEPPDSKPH